MVRLVERGIGALAVAAYRRPWRVAGCIALFVIASAMGLSRLSVNADLTELLPRSFQSLADLEVAQERFGGIGYLVLVARGAPVEVLKRFADDVAPRIEELSRVRFVQHQRPVAFFEEHALYFLDEPTLADLAGQLETREQWERKQRNPFLIDLEESEPPPLDLTALRPRHASGGEAWLSRQIGEEYFVDEGGRMIAMLVKPSRSSGDLAFAKEFVAEVKELIASIPLADYHPGLEVAYTGRYQKRLDTQSLIETDLRLTSIVALLLMLGYLALHFRRLLAVVWIMVPLLLGLLGSYGFAGFAFGDLNILTGFIGAILLGLGVDHGVHLLDRFGLELSRRPSAAEAISVTFGNTGRAVVIAALTTTVGFYCISISEFGAFREFGIVAGTGMLLVVIAYTTALPVLLRGALALGWRPGLPIQARSVWLMRLVLGKPALAVAGVAAVVMVAVLAMPTGRFDYDFESLEANQMESFVLDKEVNRLLGYSQTPAVVLAQEPADERRIVDALRGSRAERGAASTVDFIAASTDLIPLDQAAKRLQIERIGRVLARIEPSWLTAEQRPMLATAKRMVEAMPFSRAELPEEVKRQFFGVEEKGEGFVLVFPSVSMSDGQRVADFAGEVRAARLTDGRPVAVAGEAMILADILEMVRHEAPPVLVLTVLCIVGVLLLLIGRLRTTIICLMPAGATLVLLFGLLPLTGLELNYLNLIVIPVLFGISIDAGVHILTRLEQGLGLEEVLEHTGRAVAGAVLTTALGFGALMLAHHQGLRSLGAVMVLGLACNVIASLVGLPAGLALSRLDLTDREEGVAPLQLEHT